MRTIGTIGAGQLGLMITEEAHRLGHRTICLDPSPDAPAFNIADGRIVAPYDDRRALEELCRLSDVVTYEFENVPGEVLVDLAKRYNIPQGYQPLFDSQDRVREKRNAEAAGLPTPRFYQIDSLDELYQAAHALDYHCVCKTRTLGYDGHGQAIVRSRDDMARAEALLPAGIILEELIDFDYETSVILVGRGDKVVAFPMGRNIHRDGILDLCIVPSPLGTAMEQRIIEASKRFFSTKGYCGILAIEYFVCGERFFFNEMAPRPHNSGHYSIEGCNTNQFRELVRFLTDEPLVEPELVAPTIMKNILGQDLPEAEKIMNEHHLDVHVHIYGKSQSRPKRKMGHITFTDMDAERFQSQWSKRFV